METNSLLVVASVSVICTLLSFWVGWALCSRSSATNRAIVDELLKQNKALSNKLVADSLPAYKALQKADNGVQKRRPQLVPDLPPDPLGRGLDEDEMLARMEEAERDEELI